jgi:hypothetical protein
VAADETSQPTAKTGERVAEQLGASEKVRLILAVLVAGSAMLGALTAWQAGKTSISADEADRAGFREKIAEVNLGALVQRNRDESIYSYLEWRSRRAYATALKRGTQSRNPADVARLQVEVKAEQAAAAEAWSGIAPAAREGAPGHIDLDQADLEASIRLRREAGAEAVPAREFKRADRLRHKREELVLCAAFMLVAAVAFTLGQVRRRRDWRIWVRVGSVLLVLATVAAAWVILT